MAKSSKHGPSRNTGSGGRNPGGGGINSAKHVKTPVRTGKPANGVAPGAVSYLGNKVGNHTEKGRVAADGFTPWKTNAPTNAGQPLGNQVALNVGRGGPGKGYVQHGQSGSQGQHGQPVAGNPTTPSQDIWASFPSPGGNVKR